MNRFLKTKLLVTGVVLSITLSSATAFAADYKVVSNDSLYKISVLFNTSVNKLITDNQLKTNTIYPGQVLDVPAKIHTVSKGDTLFLIAKKYGVSLYSLRKANNKWDDMLIPGQTLLLPGIQPSSTVTNNATTNPTAPTNPTATTTDAKAVIPYTKEEVDLLARLITAETTGEPYSAMVAVGGVVVNRVQNPDWPSSITAVINHVAGGYYQFTPVKNGLINNTPSDLAVKAAWDALYGSDPSNGAQFYFDDSSTNQWLWSKTVTARIGSMVYVK